MFLAQIIRLMGNLQSVRNITARLLDAMTGKRWLAYSIDGSRFCQFDIDFYCSEFRLTRIYLVISLCLNIIHREMGRNLPVSEDWCRLCSPCEATVEATLRSVFISGKSLGFNETLDPEIGTDLLE